MHTIRVYKKTGGLVCTFRGLNAEQELRASGYADSETGYARSDVYILR